MAVPNQKALDTLREVRERSKDRPEIPVRDGWIPGPPAKPGAYWLALWRDRNWDLPEAGIPIPAPPYYEIIVGFFYYATRPQGDKKLAHSVDGTFLGWDLDWIDYHMLIERPSDPPAPHPAGEDNL